MTTKINKNILGTSKNDTLTNNNTSGFTYMNGFKGNDTYIIKNISKTSTFIKDYQGKDVLQIKNIKAEDLLFLFDITANSESDDLTPFYDNLIIAQKSLLTSILPELHDYLEYNIEPSRGIVCYYFGDGDVASQKQHAQDVYVVDANGVKYNFNLNTYATAIIPKVKEFLLEHNYYSSADILKSDNEILKSELLDIYKNQTMNYTITGSKYNDTIKGNNGNDVINGDAGSDKLYGGSGNDTIKGGNDNDNIYGEDGNDKLYGGDGNDKLYGGDGNDKLYGGDGNDKLDGGKGNDTIKANSGNDSIWGGKGNDKIYFSSGDNTAYFANGDGADIVYKGTGNDTLKFTSLKNLSKLKATIKVSKSGDNLKLTYSSKDSITLNGFFKDGTSVKALIANNGSYIDLETFLTNNSTFSFNGVSNKNNSITGTNYKDIIKGKSKIDTLIGGDGNDKLYGYAGNDILYGGNGLDKLYGGNGNDKLYGGNDKDILYGKKGADKLYGEEGNDILKGGSGNDKLYGGDGNDKLYGETGNDIIKANSGDDAIWGGKGNDKIYFNSGNNTAYFANGDGADIVYKGTGNDTIKFTSLKNLSKLKATIKVSKSGDNLKLTYSSKDSITLNGFFKDGTSVKTLMANDGSYIDFETFSINNSTFSFVGISNKNNSITGTDYKDIIKGQNKIDTLIGGDGNDKLYGYAGNDVLYGGNGEDTLYGGEGNDTLYGDNGNDILYGEKGADKLYGGEGNDTIKGGDGNDTLDGGDGNDKLYGETGNDTIYTGTGDDIVTGGTGDDRIYIQGGNNVIKFSKGDGNDIIYNATPNDTLKFTNIKQSDLTFAKNGNNLVIGNKSNKTDTMTIANYFTDNDLVDTYYALNSNGELTEYSLFDSTMELLGKYVLTNNSDVKIINNTDGIKSILNINEYELSYEHDLTNNNLIIKFGNNSSVILKDYYLDNFSDIKIDEKNLSDLIQENTNEIYDYANGCTITEIFSNGGVDILKFEGNTILTYEHNINNSDLIIKFDDKTITLKNYFEGEHSVTTINNHNISELIKNNINEIYDYANGCNVTEIFSNGGNDKLIFPNNTTLVYEHNINNSDLIIKSDERIVSLKNYFENEHSVTTIQDQNIKELIENNINEIYDFANGCNVKEIISNGGNDTLIFANGTNLSYYQYLTNNDLIIKYNNEDSVAIKNYFGNNEHSIRTILNGNSVLILDNEVYNNLHVYPTKGNSYFKLGDGIYTIENAGNCSISIEPNNNSLDVRYYKEQEDLIIEYSTRFGSLIQTYSNGIVINGTPQVTYDDKIIIKNYFTKNFNISLTYANNTTSVNNDLQEKGVILLGTSNNDIIRGTSNKDLIIGNGGNDIIYGGTGDDFIIAGNGNDLIYDEDGNDIIDAGDGDDIINGGIGSNTIYGGKGNDTYINSDLSNYDSIYDEAGADDKIKLTNIKKEELSLYFDVQIDSNGEIIDYLSKNLYLTKTDDFGKSNVGIKIKDYFDERHEIETITTADNYTITLDSIKILRKDVASWLFNNGYESVDAVISSGNNSDIASLKSVFNTPFENNVTIHKNEIKILKGSSASDTYNITLNTGSKIYISDLADDLSSGGDNDILNITTNINDISLMFNICKDSKNEWNAYIEQDELFDTERSDSLLIFNKESLTLDNLYDFMNNNGEGFVEINSYFDGNGLIESINAVNNENLFVPIQMDNWINDITSQVASWMSSHEGYNSSMDVFINGSDADKTSLLQIYQNSSSFQ